MKLLHSFYKISDKVIPSDGFDISEANEVLYGDDYYNVSEPLLAVSNSLIKWSMVNVNFIPKIALCLSKVSIGQYKDGDCESILQGIITILENLKSLPQGVHYGLFYNSDHKIAGVRYNRIRAPLNIWSFDRTWKGDGDYIVLRELGQCKEWQTRSNMSFVYEQAEENNLKVVTLKYGQKIAYWLDMFEHCKCIFTERGPFPLFSAMMGGIPLFMVTRDPYEPIMPCDHVDELSACFFNNNALGLNPDTLYLEGGKVINKRYSEGVMMYHDHNNDGVLKSLLDGKHPKEIQKMYLINNFDSQRSILKEIVDRAEAICQK